MNLFLSFREDNRGEDIKETNKAVLLHVNKSYYSIKEIEIYLSRLDEIKLMTQRD